MQHLALWPYGAALLALGVVALAWSRARPKVVLAVTAAVALTYYLAGFPPGPEPIPFLLALIAVAAAGHRILAAAAGLAAVVAVALLEAGRGQAETLVDLTAIVATLAAVIGVGEAYRLRRANLAASHRRAAEEERLRIARELHDAISHQLAVINLHAEAALARHETRPGLALEALATISATSREALRDIRSTLGAVRGVDGAPVAGDGSLADLPRLAERLRGAGVAVEATLPDPPDGVPSVVQRAAVRIVQESLTNATRHARPRAVDLTVSYEPQAIRLEIGNDGRAEQTGVPGQGIAGMRERAQALGGEFSAGQVDGGRFRVYARLPWRSTQ